MAINDRNQDIHMANLATIQALGLKALTPAIKQEIMDCWWDEQLGKLGYDFDQNWRRRFDAYFLPESAVAQLKHAEADRNTDLTVWNDRPNANSSVVNLEDLEQGGDVGVPHRPLTLDDFLKQRHAEISAEGCNLGMSGWAMVIGTVLLVAILAGVVIGVSQYYRLHPTKAMQEDPYI